MVPGYSSISDSGIPYVVVGDGLPTRLVIPGVEPEVEVAEGLMLQGVRSAFEDLAEGGAVCVAWRRSTDGNIELSRVSDHYIDLIRELELTDVSIIGISTGSLMAIEVAARLGQRCAKLALVAGGSRVSPEGARLLEAAIADASAGRWRHLAARQMRAYYPGFVEGRALAAIAWMFPQLFGTPSSPDHYIDMCRMILNADVRARVGDVRAPVLLVSGERDLIFPIDEAREASLLADDGRLEVVPRAGHGVFKSHAQRVMRILKDFVAD